MTPTEVRLSLLEAGYLPLPLEGKAPNVMKGWQNKLNTNPDEVRLWEKIYSSANNTGILTRRTPAIDIDILHPEAAEAVEYLVKDRFADYGPVLVRTGKPPKRAIIFRTDTPFPKILAKLIAPDGSDQRLEFLADGQQVVAHGVHPETGRPYSWHGGMPGDVRADELPEIDEAEAKRVVEAAVELLVSEFGYRRAESKKANGAAHEPGAGHTWGDYLDGLIDHDVLVEHAAALISSGMSAGAATNYLRAMLDRVHVDDPARKARRLSEIPGIVQSAANKFGGGEQKTHVPFTVAPFAWRNPAEVPRRSWLYGRFYSRKFVSLTIADGGTGKSITRVAGFLSMCSGKGLLGIEPAERVRVLYWNGDDPYDEVERRIHAACQFYNIDGAKLFAEGWLYATTSDRHPLILAEMKGSSTRINEQAFADLQKFILDQHIGLVIVDPLKACHRIPENSNTDIDALVDRFNKLAVATDAAIGIDHHTRKLAFGQAEATSADARGSGALMNKVRISRVFNTMSLPDAVRARIKEEDRVRYFRVDRGKANIVPPQAAQWFRIVSVDCLNGDQTPTVERWSFPGPLDNVTVDHMHRVRTLAAEGHYRKDPRAEDWIGHAVAEVLNLDADDKADRKQINTLLQQWLKSKALKTERRKDANRETRTYVVPGPFEGESQ